MKPENAEYGDKDLEELGSDEPLDSVKLEAKIQELNQRLKAQNDKPDASQGEAIQVTEPAQPAAKPSKTKKKRGRRSKTGLQKTQDALKKLEETACLGNGNMKTRSANWLDATATRRRMWMRPSCA